MAVIKPSVVPRKAITDQEIGCNKPSSCRVFPGQCLTTWLNHKCCHLAISGCSASTVQNWTVHTPISGRRHTPLQVNRLNCCSVFHHIRRTQGNLPFWFCVPQKRWASRPSWAPAAGRTGLKAGGPLPVWTPPAPSTPGTTHTCQKTRRNQCQKSSPTAFLLYSHIRSCVHIKHKHKKGLTATGHSAQLGSSLIYFIYLFM